MEDFNVVIVGSGYGGSVLACRLAQAGLKVCVLERGKTYPPGSFPRTPHATRGNFWDPTAHLYGMYNISSFRGIDVVTASGLGGGSLINANVMLRKPVASFEHWPLTFTDLAPHYEQVEQMLNVQQYPYAHAPYSQTFKTAALKEAAEQLGLTWELPNLAITFKTGDSPVPGELITQPNLHEQPRYTCRLCGECDIGCNFGSKNSLDFNYLTAAKAAGAAIRTLSEVHSFTLLPDGSYLVYYVKHDPEIPEGQTLSIHLMRTKRLILSAGTLGSTYLLLKNRHQVPKISKMLGQKFSGNGDYLAFAMNAKTQSGSPRNLAPTRGPVITSMITAENTSREAGQREYYVQDAAFPEPVAWLVEQANVWSTLGRLVKFSWNRFLASMEHNPNPNISSLIANVLGPATLSASSLPLLAMGHDVADGVFRLEDNHLMLNWTIKSSEQYFKEVEHIMKKIAHTWNANFRVNPLSCLRRVITVHPLGGCPMGTDEKNGVVNNYGEVFNYPGLYIADGSVMPESIGPNPALTIAAFANRCAEHIIQQIHNGKENTNGRTT